MRTHTFKTNGYSDDDNLSVDYTPATGNAIEDGVQFQHDDDGWWLISFKDLEAIYTQAKAARS